ncbi:unnamed protein product [Bursaphelenchus xylophilus]|uniref:(pine wood nematode) hypothetical protein n=1 Tax=Bursaphelenchus xylophilus TaxID=6326 RepID=A0A1I7S6Q3_BURXY|nr:unnamed protein product [Bursaphelenchus xylophilus]CAG9120669.1 unnamed protein product [Bursaphelenchus xylophilus]
MEAMQTIDRIIGNVVEQLEGLIVELPTNDKTIRTGRYYNKAVSAQDFKSHTDVPVPRPGFEDVPTEQSSVSLDLKVSTPPLSKNKRAKSKEAAPPVEDIPDITTSPVEFKKSSGICSATISTSLISSSDSDSVHMDSVSRTTSTPISISTSTSESIRTVKNRRVRRARSVTDEVCKRCGKKRLPIDLNPLVTHPFAFPEDGIRCLPRKTDLIYEELNKRSLLLIREIDAQDADRLKSRFVNGKSYNSKAPGGKNMVQRKSRISEERLQCHRQR